ncbi:putative Na(+)-dependent symporter [Methanocella arvoryzae MRE50]|uniref:Na(+)-dependent symporter n=2 Tax=Methanocella TaxID=570266 RepID=Q0W7R6_METAR|nr:putative Na(+)-dependent symporter [Methanocella arvoryzae MRE50]
MSPASRILAAQVTMTDTILTIIQAGAAASIFAYSFSRGLSVRPGDLWYLGRRPGLLLKSLLAVDVLVPLLTIIVIALVRPARATAVGLLILAASPAAPLVLKKIPKAGGAMEYAVSLHVALASLAIVTTPVTLALLSTATGLPLEISLLAVAGQIGASILLPILAGMIAGWLFPALAKRLCSPLEALSGIVMALVVLLLLLSTYHLLLTLDLQSYVAIVLVIAGALVAGRLVVAGQPEKQATLALECASRNVGLALLIASTFTPLENALPVLIPYLVISAVAGLIYARYQKIVHGVEPS